MYTIYIPKREREKVEHEITKVIHTYLKLRPNTSGVICFPGFMTNNNLIESYWLNLFGKFVNDDFYVSLSRGMTGKRKQIEDRWDRNKNTISNGSINKLKYLDINIPTLKDHSKVMLFYKWKGSEPLCKLSATENAPLEGDALMTFIENCAIEAVLIGSSNQSYSTYFGKPAAYGETDIMLIACDHLNDTNCRTPKEIFFKDVRDKESSDDITSSSVRFDTDKCVVAKSINYTSYDRDVAFFKKIAEYFLGINPSDVFVAIPQW